MKHRLPRGKKAEGRSEPEIAESDLFPLPRQTDSPPNSTETNPPTPLMDFDSFSSSTLTPTVPPSNDGAEKSQFPAPSSLPESGSGPKQDLAPRLLSQSEWRSENQSDDESQASETIKDKLVDFTPPPLPDLAVETKAKREEENNAIPVPLQPLSAAEVKSDSKLEPSPEPILRATVSSVEEESEAVPEIIPEALRTHDFGATPSLDIQEEDAELAEDEEDEAETEEAPFLIQTQGLVKQYGGRRVVNGVDISVRAGEVVGLLGRNGAGKTTTFYMIVGLVPPTEGHVFMGEEDVTHMPMYRRARRGIGYLPQEESIFRKLTVEENLLAILETLPISQAEREQRCDELLQDFGLEHVRDSVSITLSGGEKRRVSIARALVTQPMLLMLDEPFSGVDPMAVHDIQQIILTLRERGLGVLITDHSVRETLSVVDRAYIIDEGRVLSEGTSDYLINDPVAREMYLGPRFSL